MKGLGGLELSASVFQEKGEERPIMRCWVDTWGGRSSRKTAKIIRHKRRRGKKAESSGLKDNERQLTPELQESTRYKMGRDIRKKNGKK